MSIHVSSVSAPPSRRRGPRPGLALGLATTALTGACVAALTVGLTIAPMEAAHGRQLGDTPGWYQLVVITLLGSALLWTALGVGGLFLGALSSSRHGRSTAATWAIILAVLAPFVAGSVFFAAFTLSLATL